jgi:SAM-dependent methyltransferase
MKHHLDREQVRACYRALLGREPESEVVVDAHLESGATLEVFLQRVVKSAEFQNKSDDSSRPRRRFLNLSTALDVDVSGSAKQMNALLAHMKGVWTKYGADDPYFSVLTNEAYRKSVIDDVKIDDFFKQGLNEFNLINGIISNNGLPSNNNIVLDFGCGLGRVGSHFALSCENYIGVDISKTHLDQAKMHFDRIGITNSEFILLEKFLKLKEIADLIFSVIVLQHNPPPVIGYLIDQMCRALKPGGILLFQVPTSLAGYKFDLKHYLANLPSEGIMEMHAFPQKEVFKIFRKHGLQPAEVFEHDMIGPIGESTIFVAVKDS